MLKTRLKMLNTKGIEEGEKELSQKIQSRPIAFPFRICYNKDYYCRGICPRAVNDLHKGKREAMKKRKRPAYRPRKSGSGLRSFLVTLLGAAAIALLGAGVWQLLDPVEYQPPLAPLTSSPLGPPEADALDGGSSEGSAPEGGGSDVTSQPPEGSSGGSSQSSGDGGGSSSGDVQVPEGEWLSSSYFDDALFVGDSITEGIKLYDVMNNATVLSSTGVNLDSLYTKDAITLADGSKVPILEASKNYTPGKIYLMMGVNSLLSDEESFRTAYARVVDTLTSQHPDAILYIQSILPVTADYEKRQNAVADNAKIDRYNEILKELAAEKQVYYLNVAEVFKDADGCLPNSASPKDGIHFGSSWYRKWFDYLRSHGVTE